MPVHLIGQEIAQGIKQSGVVGLIADEGLQRAGRASVSPLLLVEKRLRIPQRCVTAVAM
jgi:hypothetical protein